MPFAPSVLFEKQIFLLQVALDLDVPPGGHGSSLRHPPPLTSSWAPALFVAKKATRASLLAAMHLLLNEILVCSVFPSDRNKALPIVKASGQCDSSDVLNLRMIVFLSRQYRKMSLTFKNGEHGSNTHRAWW